MARVFLNQIWLTEHRKEAPNWTRYRTVVERVYSTARRLDITGLAQAAAGIAVRVTDEDLNDIDAAIAFADKFVEELGEYPALLNARARIHSRRGEDSEACALWRAAIPAWHAEEDDLAPSYACRDAALAAARLNDWALAAQFLSEGARRTSAAEQEAFYAGLLVDAGFAFWKSENNEAALQNFVAGVELMDRMEDRAKTEPVRSLRRRAGHALMWVSAATDGRLPAQFSEPPAAFCSNLDPLPEPVPSLAPFDFILENLVRFEQLATNNDEFWARYRMRLRGSAYGAVRVTHAELSVRRDLAKLAIDELLSAAVDQIESLILAQHHRDAGTGVQEPLHTNGNVQIEEKHVELIRGLMLYGAYALAARGHLDALPIERWRQDAVTRGLAGSIDPFLRTADAILISKTVSAWEAFRAPSEGRWESQHLAALALSLLEETDPNQMIYAHAHLVAHLLSFSNRDLVASDFAAIVSQAWQRLAERPFQLRNPRYSVPRIQAAINSPASGWEKSKEILKAVLDAVSIPAADFARTRIRNMP